MIMPSIVKGIITICCVDGHDYNDDAREDDEGAEAGFGSFLRPPPTMGRCIMTHWDNHPL
jgi:hypothetical protein